VPVFGVQNMYKRLFNKHGFIQLKVYAPNMQTALRVEAIGEKVCFR